MPFNCINWKLFLLDRIPECRSTLGISDAYGCVIYLLLCQTVADLLSSHLVREIILNFYDHEIPNMVQSDAKDII